ncbi:MAG: response regulator transcription factor, partial [Chloroflexia bacterium]
MAEAVRVLAVDDEANICFFLEEALSRAGYVVVSARSGEEALERLREECFQVVILDLSLGGRVDGMRVLEAVKWRWPDSAVIILTAHGSLDSALAAIREGVDGYLLKPVTAEEVRQAVREVLARGKHCPPPEERASSVLARGSLVVEIEAHKVTRNDRAVELTPREFALLVYLMKNAGRVVPVRELVRVVQGYDAESEIEAREVIKWYVHRLRRKIEEDPARPRYIQNVRGVGYR